MALEAADGRSAIDLFRSRQSEVDVILLDMTIPGTPSREVVAEVRAIQPGVKVVLTTAYSREIATESFAGMQIDSFIRKPYRISELLEVLQSTLSR